MVLRRFPARGRRRPQQQSALATDVKKLPDSKSSFAPSTRDRIDSLNLFVRAARAGSFTRAARDLGVSQPVASRTIASLERDVGAALFTRTTRAVVLTDAGQEFLTRIEPILSDLEEAYHAVSGSLELRGVLRIGLSSSFAIREIVPRLPKFLERHPALKVEMLCSDQRQDLVLEGVDVALRLGKLPDSTATARRLGRWKRVMLASPAYLERTGVPRVPADLSALDIIAGPLSLPSGWTFHNGDQSVSVKLESRVGVTLNEAAIAAAVAGLGVVVTGITRSGKELETGQLVQLLPDWTLDPIDVHAVYAAGNAAKPAARALTDFLIEDLAARQL